MKILSPFTENQIKGLIDSRDLFIEYTSRGWNLSYISGDIFTLDKSDFENWLEDNHNDIYKYWIVRESDEDGMFYNEFNQEFYNCIHHDELTWYISRIYLEECVAKGIQITGL